MENNETFHTLLRQRGYRLTPQRQLILAAVGEAGGHCTPEEIYTRVQTKSSAINRTTVYRTLEFLVQLGLVTTAHLHDHQVIYELADKEPHHHLVCQECGYVASIDHALIAPMFSNLEQQMGYQINTDHLVLFGICPECRAATKPAHEHER